MAKDVEVRRFAKVESDMKRQAGKLRELKPKSSNVDDAKNELFRSFPIVPSRLAVGGMACSFPAFIIAQDDGCCSNKSPISIFTNTTKCILCPQ